MLSATGDIYFFIGLPLQGRVLVMDPHLPREDRVETIVARHCSRSNPMSGSVVWIEALDDLLTKYIVAMEVRIYGSWGTQCITDGQLRVVEEVLDGDLFTWGVLMQTRMVSQLNRCRHADSGDFTIKSVLVVWFLEMVPLLRPWILLAPASWSEP
jgi:hypothetical protein